MESCADKYADTQRRTSEGARTEDTTVEMSGFKKLQVNQQQLRKAWKTSQRPTRDDWSEWLRRLSVELLKESPSHALRACAELAGLYHPLARELFNAGFVSCWTELYDDLQVSDHPPGWSCSSYISIMRVALILDHFPIHLLDE